MKKVLITGVTGQDGIILSKILIKKKFKVFGFINKNIKIKNSQLKYYNIKNKNFQYIKNKLDEIKPNVIIHLGSKNPSFNKSFNKKDYELNLLFTKKLVNYIINKKIKFIFPSSFQIFFLLNTDIMEVL